MDWSLRGDELSVILRTISLIHVYTLYVIFLPVGCKLQQSYFFKFDFVMFQIVFSKTKFQKSKFEWLPNPDICRLCPFLDFTGPF